MPGSNVTTEAPTLLTVEVPSASTPGKTYLMGLAPISGWVHLDNTCPARVDRCRHIREAEGMTSLAVIDPTTGEVMDTRQAYLVEYDAEAIGRGVDAAIAVKWAYDLRGQGKGVGIAGATEGQRLLASRGEVIEVTFVELDSQTDRTSFWRAGATRWALNPEDPTQRIFAGNTVVYKEQSKYERHSDSWMRDHPGEEREYLNPHWYAIGSAKARRNAILELTPSNVKSAILRAGLAAQGQPQRPRPTPAPQEPVAARKASEYDQARERTFALQEQLLATPEGTALAVAAAAKAGEQWPQAVGNGRFQWQKLPLVDLVAFIDMLEDAVTILQPEEEPGIPTE